MKVFVSGQLDDVDFVNSVQTKLKDAGHIITHDWTSSDVFLGSSEAKLNNPDEAGVRAEKDIQGVIDADVYVICTSNESLGKGMYVELGAALALAQSYKPDMKIFVLGKLNHLSVFYLHPMAIRVKTIEELISLLND